MKSLLVLFSVLLVSCSALDLITFDNSPSTTYKFVELNDPVMGGLSTGNWSVDVQRQVGIMQGEVVDVPKLKAPGFITAAADGPYPDLSNFLGGSIVLTVRTNTPEYKGFRFSFAAGTLSPRYACAGGGTLPLSRGCFKAPAFNIPAGEDFSEIRIPLSTFSDKWSPSTGEQIKTCAEDADVCPSAKALKAIKRMDFWAEGAKGLVSLEVKSVAIEAANKRQTLNAEFSPQVSIPVVTFDGTPATTFKFVQLNDPVMGGKSSGTWSVEGEGNNKFGVMRGTVVNVPKLSAPGFIKASADGSFPDMSAVADGELVLMARSSSPTYSGFRLSFAAGTLSPAYACAGGGQIPLSRGCFKASFTVPPSSEFSEIRIPFSSFTDLWSPATGNPTSSCKEDSSACVTPKVLKKVKRFEVWAEGVNGDIELEVLSITATSGSSSSFTALVKSQPPAQFATCSGPVQSSLRFGISGRNTPAGVPVDVDEFESLAEAVCCDSRTLSAAEPQFLYEAPDIQLFQVMQEEGNVTVFYDSVCGIPLFRAPVGRTFEDFQADTQEHGWPSFRVEEVVFDNVVTDKTTGQVTSKCGTHLGSFLPDPAGPRWCIDLSCIAGNTK